MKVLLGIQARSESKRLPGKIFMTIGEKSLLEWVYSACKKAEKKLQEEGFAVETKVLGPKGDQKLEDFCAKHLLRSEFPDCEENNLVKRYLLAADSYTHLVRVTADCPLTQASLICDAVRRLKEDDYTSNTAFRTFAEGFDVQASSVSALKWLEKKEDREHPFFNLDSNASLQEEFKAAGFHFGQMINPQMSFLIKAFSIDTLEELNVAREMYAKEKAG